MTLAELIASLEAKRAANVARMEAISKAVADDARTMNTAETEEFDTLATEVDQIDADLTRQKRLQTVKVAATKPTPKPADVSGKTGSDARDPAGLVVVVPRKLPPGIAFTRLVKAQWLAKKLGRDVVALAKELYPDDMLVQKAAVAAGSTTGTTWGHQLVGDETQIFADFAEFLRPMTIIGKFGANGVPALMQVPFRTALIGQTGGGTGYWVGEGKGKPLTAFGFGRTTLEQLKVANIAVTTEELLRSSSPSAEIIVRNSLAGAIVDRTDTTFIDPAAAAVANVSPASITNGVTPIPSSGNDAAAVREDLRQLFGAFIAANNTPVNGVFVMANTTALALSLMVNALGQPEFPGVTMLGGTLSGLPITASQYVPSDVNGSFVSLVNASDIYFADDGDVSVEMSTEASLNMVDNPTQAADSPPVPTQVVSMFQTNSVAFRAERTLNWSKRRPSAVALLSAVQWGQPGSPL